MQPTRTTYKLHVKFQLLKRLHELDSGLPILLYKDNAIIFSEDAFSVLY